MRLVGGRGELPLRAGRALRVASSLAKFSMKAHSALLDIYIVFERSIS